MKKDVTGNKKGNIILSIVLVTYNRKNECIRCLKSIICNYDPSYELIIVDNCSNDGTEEEVKNFTENIENFKYIKLDCNYGPSYGKNIGFKNSAGKYIYFIDDDAYINNNEKVLMYLIKMLDDNKEIGAISNCIYDTLKKKRLEPTKSKNSNMILYFQGGSHIIRKEAIEGKDLYPDGFEYGSEELFASLRIYNKGYNIIEDYTYTIIHSPSKITSTSKEKRIYGYIVNRACFKFILYPKGIRPILYLVFVLKIIKNYGLSLELLTTSMKRVRYCLRLPRYKNYRISYNTIFKMIKLFGIKNII